MTAAVLEEMVEEERNPYLIWRNLASFFNLLTVTLLNGAEGSLGKIETYLLALIFLELLVAFASSRDCKLTYDGLGFRRNGHG